MISSNKKYLKRMCNQLKPKLHIGKDGLSSTVLEELDRILENHELVKISILQSCPIDSKEAFTKTAELANAELIQSIGRKFCLYRRSSKKQVIFFSE
ncbi:MAG: YhbY family RNA-binding protein [Elusimicrobiota bacterium]